MDNYIIGTLNNISNVGLGKLKSNYKLTENVNEANGIIVRSYKMHDMEFSDNLMAIGRAGAGVNNIPLDRCADKGIVVFNAPGANSNAVKELVIGALIMGARNLYEGIRWANTITADIAQSVEKGKKQFAGTEISGKTLGIIGLGAIGAQVANAAHALGMNIVGNSVVISDRLTAPCKMYDDLSEMVQECDYISIHVPSLPETKGMINKNIISGMKDGVILLNFARPDLVVDEDILAAIESGKIRKYLTDLPNDTIAGKEGVITTPHLGASTAEAEDNCATMVVNQLMDYFENGSIINSVNFPTLSVDAKPGTKKLCVLYKNIEDIEKVIRESVDKVDSVFIGKRHSEYGYAIALIDAAAHIPDFMIDGILKIRVI